MFALIWIRKWKLFLLASYFLLDILIIVCEIPFIDHLLLCNTPKFKKFSDTIIIKLITLGINVSKKIVTVILDYQSIEHLIKITN